MNSQCLLLPLASLAFVLSASSFAGVGQSGPGGPPALEGSYTFSLPLASGAFGRTGSGDFDGDGQEDVVLMSADQVDVFFSPGIHETLILDIANPGFPRTPSLDFTILKGFDGGDKIALLDSAGLVLIDVDSNSTSLGISRDVLGGFTGCTMLNSWQGADGSQWIAGVDAAGSSMHLASNTDGTWVFAAPIPTGAPTQVLDLVVFKRDGSGGAPQVAILLGSAYGVYDPWGSGAPALSMTPGIAYLDVVRLERGGPGGMDRLVFLGELASGPFFAVWTAGVVSNFSTLPASEEFYSLTTGRFDTDTLDDIVLAGDGSQTLFVMPDQAETAAQPTDFNFNSDYSYEYSPFPNSQVQTAAPLFVDVDHDGDGDLIYAVNGTMKFWVGRTGVVDASLQSVTLNKEAFGPAQGSAPATAGHLTFVEVDTNGDGVLDDVEWKIDFVVILPDEFPGQYLDVLTWQNPAGAVSIDPQPVDSQRFDAAQLTPGGSLTIRLAVDGPGEAFEMVDGEFVWNKQLYTIFQFVEAPGGSDEQTFCYPAQAIVYAPDSGTFNPPHTPDAVFQVSKTYPAVGGLGGDEIPRDDNDPIIDGTGDDTQCAPSSRPPVRP